MADGKACFIPGCGFVTTTQVPDNVDRQEQLIWLRMQMLELQFHDTSAHPIAAAPQAAPVHHHPHKEASAKLSRSAKKRRRKRNSSNQTEVSDNNQDTAPMEVSQSDSEVLVVDVGVCVHGMVKLMYRGEVARLF